MIVAAAGLMVPRLHAQPATRRAAIDSLLAGAAVGRPTLRALCGRRVDLNAGIVFGVVRDVATRAPVAGAGVAISWYEPLLVRGVVRADIRHVEGAATDVGTYALCGVALHARASLAAQVGRRTVGPVHIEFDSTARRREDLVAPVGDAGSGVVTGTVRGPDGRTAPLAEVRIGGYGETLRTDSSGRFRIPDIPAGTREVQVRMIGATPTQRRVDVRPDAETSVEVALSRAGQALPTVNVYGLSGAYARSGFDERRRAGRGFLLGERDIANMNAWDLADVAYRAPWVGSTMVNGRRSLSFPGTSLQRLTGPTYTDTSTRVTGCPPRVFLNGSPVLGTPFVTALEMVMDWIRPEDLYGIEMYRYDGYMPAQFRGTDQCPTVVLWTRSPK